jgi:saccharopine dehydrogenase-like NADP-dependent oxidoreductase
MEEKTIRYAGHAELLKSLIEYGFQPDSENPFTNPKIKPNRDILDFLNEQLNPASVHGSGTSQYDDKDLSILIVEIKKGKRTMEYTCIDYYDEKNKITSMARMTAYTGSIITQCIKDYPGFGVIAPEYLGTNKDICNFIKTELKRRNITIKSNNTLRAT